MNSTTSPDAYVPFWVVQDFLDCAAPDPFLPVKIVSSGTRHLTGPGGTTILEVCDIEIKPGLMASGIPRDYLIQPSELGVWAERIAAWFRDYPAKIGQGAHHEAQTDTHGGA